MSSEHDHKYGIKRKFVPLSERTRRMLERVQGHEEGKATSPEEAKEFEKHVEELKQADEYEDYLEQHPELVEQMYEESQEQPISIETMESSKAKLNRRVPSTSFIESSLPKKFRLKRFVEENEIPQRAFRYGILTPATAIDRAYYGTKGQFKILKHIAGIPLNQRSRVRKRIIKRVVE